MKYYLLDDLAKLCRVNYLSELKDKLVLRSMKEEIEKLDESKYSLEDWEEICSYLMNDCNHIQSIKEAKRKLLAWLDV